MDDNPWSDRAIYTDIRDGGQVNNRVRVELTKEVGTSSITYVAEDATRDAAIETLLALQDADGDSLEE